MDHRHIQERLFDFYDGELSGSARGEVQEHVAGCGECRALLEQWKRAAGLFFRAPAVQPSEAFVHGVMRRIRQGEVSRPEPFQAIRRFLEGSWWLPALGLASLLYVLVTGPAQQAALSIESLLLPEGNEPAAFRQILTGESPSSDEILGLVMEDVS